MKTIELGIREEQKTQQLVGTFAALAIFISWLSSFWSGRLFTANQRVKELQVRKVLAQVFLGCSICFSKDFLKLVALALFNCGCLLPGIYTDEWISRLLLFNVALIGACLLFGRKSLLLGVALTYSKFSETIRRPEQIRQKFTNQSEKCTVNSWQWV